MRQQHAVTPDGNTTIIGYFYPPHVMVVDVVQHMTECRARAMIVLRDLHERCLPQISRLAVRALELSKAGIFRYPHHQGGLGDYVYTHHGMRAV